jgi:hypothetical protein
MKKSQHVFCRSLVALVLATCWIACSDAPEPSTKVTPPSGFDGKSGSTPKPAAPEAALSTTDASDPCKLLSQPDAAAAFGQAAEGGPSSAWECRWASKADLKVASLEISTDVNVEEWRAGFEQSRSWIKVTLGDEAYRSAVISSVEIRVGTTVYELNVNYSTDGNPDAIVDQFSEKLIQRLGLTSAQ